jgi:tryptophan-rich sensory protein
VPAWLVLLFSMILVLLVLNPSAAAYTWWMGKPRPAWWMGYQVWVPLLWMAVLIPLYVSALTSWNTTGSVPLMGAYGALLLLIKGSSWLMCQRRSLVVGVAGGLVSWACGIALTIAVSRVSAGAALGLLPFLIWSPLETWVTWRMLSLQG